ncbi:MAG: DUF2787 family protein [Deferrisomatales bacterium]|nr:DUF2787 family protein [Deferrisomatales bacterium]
MEKTATLTVAPKGYPFPVSRALIAILQQELDRAGVAPGTPAIVHFRDPDYSPETGGFHPVEVSVAADGTIQYLTDFAFYGSGPFAELGKEIDFDFGLELFQHMGREFPIARGRELFQLWQSNFCAYHRMGTYTVEVVEGP